MMNLFSNSKSAQPLHRVRPIGGDIERDDLESSSEESDHRVIDASALFERGSASVVINPRQPVKGAIIHFSAGAVKATEAVGRGTVSVLDAVGSLIREEVVFSVPKEDQKPNKPTPLPLREYASPPPKPQSGFVEAEGKIISLGEAQRRREVNVSSTAGVDRSTGQLTADARAQVEQSMAEERKRAEAAAKRPYDIARARAGKIGAQSNTKLNTAPEGSSMISSLKAG